MRLPMEVRKMKVLEVEVEKMRSRTIERLNKKNKIIQRLRKQEGDEEDAVTPCLFSNPCDHLATDTGYMQDIQKKLVKFLRKDDDIAQGGDPAWN